MHVLFTQWKLMNGEKNYQYQRRQYTYFYTYIADTYL